MNFLECWVRTRTEQDRLRAFEIDLGLKKYSIRCEFERRLYLTGISIEHVSSIYDKLVDIAAATPFELRTIELVYMHIHDVEKTSIIMHEASKRAIDPFIIIKAMQL